MEQTTVSDMVNAYVQYATLANVDICNITTIRSWLTWEHYDIDNAIHIYNILYRRQHISTDVVEWRRRWNAGYDDMINVASKSEDACNRWEAHYNR